MKSLLICLILCATAVTASAQNRTLEQVRFDTARLLFENPDNRAVRFRYAKVSYHTGNYRSAKFHLLALMRTSKAADDLALLKRVHGTVVETAPLSFGLNLSILPSTNISRTSSNQIFDTLAGTYRIVDGGQEESGVGLRFGGRMTYETVLPNDGGTLTYSAALNRNQYPVDRLNSFDGTLSVTWGQHGLRGTTQITPYVFRNIYDQAGPQNADSTRIGVKASYEHYLTDKSSITGTISVEKRNYDGLDYLDGPVLSLGASYTGPVFDQSSLGFGILTTHSKPTRAHLQYTGISLWGEITTPVFEMGTLGLNASLGGRNYDGIFPALAEARQDRFASIGISFSSARIRVWDTIPKLSCQIEQNRSNVALYEYKSKDCALTFVQNF